MKYTIVGDVHGKYGQFEDILKSSEYPVIQVGDMAYGFSKRIDDGLDKLSERYDYKFIRGNHDDPNVCRKKKEYIEDGTFCKTMNAKFIGGAFSIDRSIRTEGVNWWSDEECSYTQLSDMAIEYMKQKPDIMITHDCPKSFLTKGFGYYPIYENRTSSAFEAMLETHKPKLWIFGHHHKNMDMHVDGTRFVCVGELSKFILDVDNLEQSCMIAIEDR